MAGSNARQELHLLKDDEWRLEEHCVIVVQRPGFNAELTQLRISGPLRRRIQSVSERERLEIRIGVSFLIPINAPAISASWVRSMLASGEKPSPDILSPAVLKYIMEHQLYET